MQKVNFIPQLILENILDNNSSPRIFPDMEYGMGSHVSQ